ncbi:MAG: hypothetical protein LBH03_07630 [Holophagales bacterium]|nr:hypothetical protein [Holophagales bacterium]
MSSDYPSDFLDLLNSVKARRPRTVIQHILKYGLVTSQELKDIYGYNHPPRAIRDARELGIPLVTYFVKGTDGRSIAAYRFGDPSTQKNVLSKSAGRTTIYKTSKQSLIEKYGSKCFIYFETMDESILQVDHRVPYEIEGERDERNLDRYMLLSPSANRAKSWTCEHCMNWKTKDISFCVKCFWAYPENYEHIAGKKQKIISIIFTGDEIKDYERLVELSGIENVQNTIKEILHKHLK